MTRQAFAKQRNYQLERHSIAAILDQHRGGTAQLVNATGSFSARPVLGKIGQQWLKIEFRRGRAAIKPPVGISRVRVQPPAEGAAAARCSWVGCSKAAILPGKPTSADPATPPQLGPSR